MACSRRACVYLPYSYNRCRATTAVHHCASHHPHCYPLRYSVVICTSRSTFARYACARWLDAVNKNIERDEQFFALFITHKSSMYCHCACDRSGQDDVSTTGDVLWLALFADAFVWLWNISSVLHLTMFESTSLTIKCKFDSELCFISGILSVMLFDLVSSTENCELFAVVRS